jgi:NifU-like protein involved in Fe-S cluster formation
MALAHPYSELVRQHFFGPAYVGELPDGPGRLLRGEAGEIARGARVQLAASVADRIVLAMRFHVFGCPYLVAALDITCARSEGEKVQKLLHFKAHEMLETLQAPPQKMGRLLLVEDAIMSLVSALDD